MASRKMVRFCLQPTASHGGGAPQREEYLTCRMAAAVRVLGLPERCSQRVVEAQKLADVMRAEAGRG
jgi:hypothetical protein